MALGFLSSSSSCSCSSFLSQEEERLFNGFHFLFYKYNKNVVNIGQTADGYVKCCNFLLLFPSGFKEFYYSTYVHVFFLVFILQEFLEEQYDSLISASDSIKGECYGYLSGVISSPRILLRGILC